jgi:hypothetical protein
MFNLSLISSLKSLAGLALPNTVIVNYNTRTGVKLFLQLVSGVPSQSVIHLRNNGLHKTAELFGDGEEGPGWSSVTAELLKRRIASPSCGATERDNESRARATYIDVV